MRHKIWLLGIFLFTLFLIGCQEDAVIEPQANVVENSGNLGKITIKKQLVVTDSLMAIEIMNDAYQHYLIAGTYETYSINPEYMVEDTLGNDQFWFDFFWYVDAFGGDYHIINLQPYYMEYNQFFYVTSTNARIWGTDMTTLTEICDNQMDDNYDGEIDEGCVPAFEPILLGEQTMRPYSYLTGIGSDYCIDFMVNGYRTFPGYETFQPNRKYMLEFSGTYVPHINHIDENGNFAYGYTADVFFRDEDDGIDDNWIQGNPDFQFKLGATNTINPQPTVAEYNPQHIYQYYFQSDENSMALFSRLYMYTEDWYWWLGDEPGVSSTFAYGEINVKFWDMGPIN